MAKETYTGKLKVQIGRVQATAKADDYFPLTGEVVNISGLTKWAQADEWQVQDGGGGISTTAGTITNQSDSKEFTVVAPGELVQKFIARNSLSETVVQKTIYAMQPQGLPYFTVEAIKEIVRADGEEAEIIVKPENGYAGVNTVEVRVYRENEQIPLTTITGFSATTSGGKCSVSFSSPSDRGAYDVEVSVTDTGSGETLTKRVNKLITVTPRLAPEPADRSTGYRDILATTCYTSYSGKDTIPFYIRLWENTGHGLSYAEVVIPSGQQNNSSHYYPSIDISVLPGGTTLVLEEDPLEPAGYTRRILFKGNNPPSVSNASGTPNNTFEKPLIITINRDTPYDVPFEYYSGLNFENNVRFVVMDGRGYKNIKKGIHIHKCDPEAWGSNCMFMTNGMSNMELFELELSDCDFTAISSKTDPEPDRPWYWFGNWELQDLWLHHAYIHDTLGEGFYIGYFTPETYTKVNSAGEPVTYRAHALVNTRVYRNRFENTGYDGIQLSNARGAEVCYNEIHNAAYRGEADQSSGMSVQSISGKVYNNVIGKHLGVGLQLGPLGDVEVFNNLVYDGPIGSPGVQLLFSNDTPEQNPDDTGVNDTMKMMIHNNVIICNGNGLNGRNTVQVMGMYFEDNILVYRGGVFSNMATATIERWIEQSSGNLLLNQNTPDFVAIDANKIADSANGNFQVSADSPLIRSGTGARFEFDFRGYKNWFTSVTPTGAFLGKYKSINVNDDPVSLTSIVINDGALSTRERSVLVKLEYTGLATRYRVGETGDLSGVAWVAIPEGGVVDHELSECFGNKTLYAQVSSASVVSVVRSATIEYQSTPLTLEGIVLNNGEASTYNLTIPVSFVYSGSFIPAKYRTGETSSLTSVPWFDFSDSVFCTFDSPGSKTLYAQLQDAEGNSTGIKSGSITIKEQGARKAIVSIGWNNEEVPGGASFENEINKRNFLHAAAKNINWNTGESLGTLLKVDAMGSPVMALTSKGAITGDNSGIYPDDVMMHNISCGANQVEFAGYRDIHFEIPAGSYKLRLFCSSVFNRDDRGKLKYQVVFNAGTADETTRDFVIPENFTAVNNLTDWLEMDLVVLEGGVNLRWCSFNTGGSFIQCPLNIIEIEEV